MDALYSDCYRKGSVETAARLMADPDLRDAYLGLTLEARRVGAASRALAAAIDAPARLGRHCVADGCPNERPASDFLCPACRASVERMFPTPPASRPPAADGDGGDAPESEAAA